MQFGPRCGRNSTGRAADRYGFEVGSGAGRIVTVS